MAYAYRFYRFTSHTEYAAKWAEAGLPLADGTPILASGAVDEIGAVSTPGATNGDPPTAVPGWHVNVAWAGEAPGSLEQYAIQPFDGLRVFAGWSDAAPPPPVPEQIDNVQARILLMQDGKFAEVDAAIRAQGGTAWQFWEYANKIYRYDSPLVEAMAVMLGYVTEAQKDEFFRRASQLSG